MASETDSREGLRRFWVTLLAGTAAFLLGLGATAWGLRSVVEKYAPAGGDKILYLTKHAADYDVVVVGSSVIAVGFRAEPFEARLRDEHGTPMRAYGLGRGGLVGPELDFYVQRILSTMPKLRWLLIEVSLAQTERLEEANWYSWREIDWQWPRQFGLVESDIMARDEPLESRLQELWPFARHFALNMLNVGRALPTVEGFDRSRSPMPAPPDSEEDAGLTYDERVALKEAAAKKYRRNRKGHAAKVRQLIARRRGKARWRSNELAATWRDAAEARGVRVAFILGPSTSSAAFPAEVPGKPDLRIFDFNQPQKYPELYDVALRYDAMHLTERGAVLFSSALADQLDAAMGGNQLDTAMNRAQPH